MIPRVARPPERERLEPQAEVAGSPGRQHPRRRGVARRGRAGDGFELAAEETLSAHAPGAHAHGSGRSLAGA